MTLQPVKVDTGSGDTEGRLVFEGDRLVAVLVHLADGSHDRLIGRWYIEAGFGRCDAKTAPVFDTLDDAETWLVNRVAL